MRVQVVITKPLKVIMMLIIYAPTQIKKLLLKDVHQHKLELKLWMAQKNKAKLNCKQNAQINYQNSSVIGNSISAGTAFNYEENTIQSVQKIPLSNKPNIGMDHQKNQSPLDNNPYAISNRTNDTSAFSKYLCEPPTDTEEEDFV